MTTAIAARLLAGAAWLGVAGPALAHGTAEPAGPVWSFDPWVLTPLLALASLHLAGSLALARRAGEGGPQRHRAGRAQRSRRAALFVSGWLALAAALVSPLHWLGERLFTFHMIEHEIVMAVAAPLFVLARPAGTLLWALPGRARLAVGRAFNHGAVAGVWQAATGPRNATVLHGLAIWIWHVPAFFDATLGDVTLHRLQHLSFLLTALLFWWSVLRRSRAGTAVWHLFVTMVHTGLLGALMALSPRVLYRMQTAQAPAWGLTPLEDQQLAGLVMWIPAETVYAGAALAMAAIWIRDSGRGRVAPAAATPGPLRP